MKIYYVINGRIPTEKANGYQVSQMCQAFLENGKSVELLRPSKKLSPAHRAFSTDLISFYNLRIQPEIKTVWSFDFQKFSSLFSIPAKIQTITNLIHTLTYAMGLIYFFWSRKKEPQECLYLRDIHLLSLIAPLVDKKIRNNIILELHYMPENILKRKAYVKSLGHARSVIAITNKMKKDLVELGYPEEKIWVEHDAVDLESFQKNPAQRKCREILNFPPNDLIVGYVGNFHTNGLEKGVDDLIRASSLVLRQHPDTKFYFIGGPMDRVPAYLDLIKSLSLPLENFKFFDRVHVSQVPVAMGACDILTIPLPWNQYFAFYMSPMKLFEYMATGRCIVATDVESIKEILVDGNNALLAQHTNTQALADKILFAINQPEVRAQLSANAQSQVKSHSWNLRAKRILDFIGVVGQRS